MRIVVRRHRIFGATLLVLALWLLVSSAQEAPSVFRGSPPAMTLRPAPSRSQVQQELFGINPDRLILYSPLSSR
jgi:hypothetical protein